MQVKKRPSAPIVAAVLALALVTAASGVGARPAAAADPVRIDVTISDTVEVTSTMEVGVTHTQYSADGWGSPDAVESARALLASAPLHQNQHIMGWGALNPEPVPGVRDFSSLDRRVRLMLDTTADPTITFAGAPDWMKGGTPGSTDWSKIEVAPLPEFYDDFARLAAAVALRYPEVRRFQVWNELKGFHDPSTNNWNIAAYTKLYNEVHGAVKAVRPDALIGGPYVVMDSWASSSAGGFPSDLRGPWGIIDRRALDAVSYWLAHSRGADFIAIDGGTSTRDQGLITSPFVAIEKFVAVTEWVKSRTSLPIVWAEWYPRGSSSNIAEHRAIMAAALAATARAGASSVLIWQPQCVGQNRLGCLFTDTRVKGGGQPTELWPVASDFVRWFPSGSQFVATDVSSDDIVVAATSEAVLLVNTTAAVVQVAGVPGVPDLDGYEVRFVKRQGRSTSRIQTPTPTPSDPNGTDRDQCESSPGTCDSARPAVAEPIADLLGRPGYVPTSDPEVARCLLSGVRPVIF